MSKRTNLKHGVTTIEPSLLEPYTHLKKSSINRTIQMANELIFTLFKQKVKLEEPHLLSLLKYFQVPIPKSNGFIDLNEMKKLEFLNAVNINILQKLYKEINFSNN